jgi:ABC-type antimicrobial peptide transport system permease subunit
MALGALDRQIAGNVLREAGVLVAAGLAVGLAGAWWLQRAAAWSLGDYVRRQLYGVSPADLSNVALAAAALAAVAAVAALLPARRAARVTPMSALREE